MTFHRHTSRVDGLIRRLSPKVNFNHLNVAWLAACLLVSVTLVQTSFAAGFSPGWPGTTLSGVECYGESQGYGPFDYTTDKDKLGVVETYHFTPEVEQLLRGKSGYIDGDLDYTLRAFPNHHRALWAMSRFYLQKAGRQGYEALDRLERVRQGFPPPECYLQRAKAFAPHDGMLPAIYGIYLHKRGKLDLALKEYQSAETKLPQNAELAYNLGLLYFDLGDVAKAEEYAHRASALGYPLSGLQNKIARARDTKRD